MLTANYPDPPIGGDRMISYNLIQELGCRHEIHLFSLTNSDQKINYNSKFYRQLASLTTMTISRRRLWLRYLFSLTSKYPYTLIHGARQGIGERIASLVDKLQPEIIQANAFGFAMYAHYMNHFPKILVTADVFSVLQRHLALNESNFLLKLYYILNSKKGTLFEKDFFPLFDKCIVVSDLQAKMLSQIIPASRICVITNGVNVTKFQPIGLPKQPFSIIFTGVMNYAPTYDAARYLYYEVLPLVRQQFPDACLYLVGANPTKELLKFGRDNANVIVTGYVDNIKSYLDKAWVYAAPIRFGTGIKNKVLEAMAMGLPIVGSTVALEGIKAKHGDQVFVAHSSKQFAQYIIQLFKDNELRIEMGRKAREFIKLHHTWSEKAKEYERIWSLVMDRYKY